MSNTYNSVQQTANTYTIIYIVVVIVVILAHVGVIYCVWKYYANRRKAQIERNIAAANLQQTVVYTTDGTQPAQYPPGATYAYVPQQQQQQPVMYAAQPAAANAPKY